MVDGGALNDIARTFLDTFRDDARLLEQLAEALLFNFTTIQLSLMGLFLALKSDSLHKFLVEFIQVALIFAAFYSLITSGSTWVPALLNSFMSIGQGFGVQSVDPSSVLSTGLVISTGMLKAIGVWGFISHAEIVISCVFLCWFILLAFTFIAAELTTVLVKSYFLIAVSGLFLSAGTWDLTRPMTVNYFKALIGLGLQLMTLYIFIGIGLQLGGQWADTVAASAKTGDLLPMMVILVEVALFYYLTKNVPPFIAGLVGLGGFRNHGDAAVAAALGAGAQSAALGAKAYQGASRLGQEAALAAAAAAHIFKPAPFGFDANFSWSPPSGAHASSEPHRLSGPSLSFTQPPTGLPHPGKGAAS